MKHLLFVSLVIILFICDSYSASLNSTDSKTDSKSAFGPVFDEIVVESHLTIRRKTNGRQGRNQNVTTEAPKKIVKREIKPRNLFNSFSAANAQAQAFNSVGPLGSFGASAAGAQSQNFGFGPNGIVGAASFAGTQQYQFNGQTIDISFGNALTNGNQVKPVITVTGKKRPFKL